MKHLSALLLCAAANAHADTCSASLSDVNFGSVSPITGSDIYASATGNISCTWTLISPTFPFVLLFPNAVVCVNLGTGSNSSSTTPRTLGSTLQYNLYRDNSYAAASIFGGPGTPATPTPLTTTMTAPNMVTGGTINQAFTVYGKIPAGASLAGVPTTGNNNTVYNSSFTGHATVTYAFYNLVQPACTSGGSASFSFQASATVINDCTIAATPVAFGATGILNGPKRATGALTVRCTNNNAYQITLNGGSVANSVAARKMKPASGAERISYNLSQTLDGAIWGDGTGATTKYSGTGTGTAAALTVYGMVPAQTTPTPGDYQDTVTATVTF